MRPLETQVKVEIYENNDKDIPIGKSEYMSVFAHWSHGNRVILIFNNKKITVIGNDLVEAIKRCSY